MILSLVIILGLGLCEAQFIPLAGLAGFLVKGLCFVAIYTAVIWIMGANEYEKELVKSTVSGITKRIFKR